MDSGRANKVEKKKQNKLERALSAKRLNGKTNAIILRWDVSSENSKWRKKIAMRSSNVSKIVTLLNRFYLLLIFSSRWWIGGGNVWTTTNDHESGSWCNQWVYLQNPLNYLFSAVEQRLWYLVIYGCVDYVLEHVNCCFGMRRQTEYMGTCWNYDWSINK